jgi:heme iron utilization protein
LGTGDIHRPCGGRRPRNGGAAAPGNEEHGYFNIHGESPLGGDLRIARCASIYFIDRPFFGRRSCSLQFINLDSGVMFKVLSGAMKSAN